MADHETTAQVLELLFDAYPRFEAPEGTARVYLLTLQDVDPALLKAAVLKHIGESEFFPTVAELRRACGRLIEHAAAEPDAYTAWEQVIREIGRVGYVGIPTFTHARIQKAVEAVGGWRYLCHSTNTPADRARFVECYDTYTRRDREDRQMIPAVRSAISLLAEKKRFSLSAGFMREPNGEPLEVLE